MSHSGDNGIVCSRIQIFKVPDSFKTVAVSDFVRIGPGIVNIHFASEILQSPDDTGDLRIAYIRTIFFESHPQYQNPCIADPLAFFYHQFHHSCGDIFVHTVVDASAGKDHFRQIAQSLSLMCQIVGVDTDTVTAHQSRFERQKVPFCSGGSKNIAGIDPHQMKDLGKFIDKGDIEIPLGILDHFGGFSHLDGTCLIGTGRQNRIVKSLHLSGSFRCGT